MGPKIERRPVQSFDIGGRERLAAGKALDMSARIAHTLRCAETSQLIDPTAVDCSRVIAGPNASVAARANNIVGERLGAALRPQSIDLRNVRIRTMERDFGVR